MKRIILVRHAKSSWEHDVTDLKRPLSNLNIKIDTIFSSPALRTKQTAEVFLKNIKPFNLNNYNLDSELYDFQGNNVEMFIKNLNNNFESVMIFTHNNSCNNLFSKFSNIKGKCVPKCGILIFEFDVSLWIHINSGKSSYYFPKNFK